MPTRPAPLLPLPDKATLAAAFVGKPLSALRTPALVVDRAVFEANCAGVTAEIQRRGLGFRAHVKTHKTSEGTRIQVEAADGVRAVVCSTLPEVWGVIDAGLVRDGLVDDILYSMPIGEDKVDELAAAQDAVGSAAAVRVMLDHASQVSLLARASERHGRTSPWSAFIKVDGGGRRAGCPPESAQMRALLAAAVASGAVDIFGFYSHFGQSYASKTGGEAADYFRDEIACVAAAADVARELAGGEGEWVLSVGATPTAHAAVLGADVGRDIPGTLEVHAGCYCMCDLQQLSTTLIEPAQCALTVLASVVSAYGDRDEAMCDAGALALSKDAGPEPGFGRVVAPAQARGWRVGRISQEHGTLVRVPAGERGREAGGAGAGDADALIGQRVRIVPQHACLVCAAFPWIYVVDGKGQQDVVVDVWVPWKGW